MVDFGNLRQMLLDRYTKEYPECSERELRSFHLAMIWMEDSLDLKKIKAELKEEFAQNNNLSKEEYNSFTTALEWMSDALRNEEHTEDALNCFIPVRTYNIYLRKQLEGVKDLIVLNEELSKRCQALENRCNNMSTLSKQELKELRKDTRYQSLLKEIKMLKENRLV